MANLNSPTLYMAYMSETIRVSAGKSLFPQRALPGKKIFQKLGAFASQNTGRDFDAMIQQLGIGQAKFAAHAAETEVARSEHQAANTSGDSSTSLMPERPSAALLSHRKMPLRFRRRVPWFLCARKPHPTTSTVWTFPKAF